MLTNADFAFIVVALSVVVVFVAFSAIGLLIVATRAAEHRSREEAMRSKIFLKQADSLFREHAG